MPRRLITSSQYSANPEHGPYAFDPDLRNLRTRNQPYEPALDRRELISVDSSQFIRGSQQLFTRISLIPSDFSLAVPGLRGRRVVGCGAAG